jgi:hypothetical protein
MTQSELMDLIFERPGMYIGHESVVKMQAFVEGYGFADIDDNVQKRKDAAYNGFGQWVVDQRKTGQYSWSAIATLIGGSEARAFGVAKELWLEYKHQEGAT